MNKKLFYGAFAFAALGLASCSSDEPVNVGGSDQTWDGDKYVAIRLNDVNAGTRAEAFNGDSFEEGTDTENQLTTENLRFYFFNEAGQPFTLQQTTVNGTVEKTNMVTPQKIADGITDGLDPIAKTAVLVLGKPDPETPYVGSLPAKVLCIAGLTPEDFDNLANRTIASLSESSSALIRTMYSENRGFVMSNSTYSTDGTQSGEIWATPIEASNFCESAQDAINNPCNIYIERLASKVRVIEGLGNHTAKVRIDGELNDLTLDLIGTENNSNAVKVEVNLVGWNTRNEQSSTKLKKQLFGERDFEMSSWAAAAPECAWNSASYHRSFWAVTPSDVNLENNGDINYDRLTVGQWDKTPTNQTDNTNIRYIRPNTCDAIVKGNEHWTPFADRNAKSTAVAVKAYVKLFTEDGTLLTGNEDVAPISDGDENNPTGTNLINYADQYYLYKDFIYNVKNAFVTSQDDYTTAKREEMLTDTEVELKHMETAGYKNYYYASVKYKGVPQTNFDNRFKEILWWENGLTTYYVNIKHANLADGTPIFGVVRNHIYDISFTDVVGLGLPGTKIEEPKDPTQSYLAAKINVLNWRIVKNSVILE